MQLAANALIFIDLYLTLKNPFYPRENRQWKYTLVLISIPILWVSIFIIKVVTGDVPESFVMIPSIGLTTALFVMSLVYSLAVMFRLCKKGTSYKLRKLVWKRHLIYIQLYLVVSFWVLYGQLVLLRSRFVSYGFDLVLIFIDSEETSEIAYYAKYVFEFFGVSLFFARVSEPFVYNNII
jgi:hypothetical protein